MGATSLPLSQEKQAAINQLKEDISKAVVDVIGDDAPFTVETDASDDSIAATSTLDGRPVAFSRALNDAEKRKHIVEKVACAIVESIRKFFLLFFKTKVQN